MPSADVRNVLNQSTMWPRSPWTLLRIDSGGGLCAGAAMLMLHDWLTTLYRVPVTLVWGVAAMNVLYGLSSGLLLLRRPVPLHPWMRRLAVANMVWALVCALLAIRWVTSASWIGTTALLLEAVFVGGLGWIEWRMAQQMRANMPN
jgi:hypothetical protein